MIVQGERGTYLTAYTPIMYVAVKSPERPLFVHVTDTGYVYVLFRELGYKEQVGLPKKKNSKQVSDGYYLVCQVDWNKFREYCFRLYTSIQFDSKSEYGGFSESSAPLVSFVNCLSRYITELNTSCVSVNGVGREQCDVIKLHEMGVRSNGMITALEETITPMYMHWGSVHADAFAGTPIKTLLDAMSERSNLPVGTIERVFLSLQEVLASKTTQAILLGLNTFEFIIPYLCSIQVVQSNNGFQRVSIKSRLPWDHIRKKWKRGMYDGEEEGCRAGTSGDTTAK